MAATSLSGGFADPARDAAYAFRAVMQAMARPGRIQPITGASGPEPLSPAAACTLLTLCDLGTPVFLAPSRDSAEIQDWITFHTSAPLCGPEDAAFALGLWPELKGQPFATGTPQYPDRSATLIVESDRLEAAGVTLCGPGIELTAQLSLPEVAAFQRNAAIFPLGVDHLFTCGSNIAGLPRSTCVSESEAA